MSVDPLVTPYGTLPTASDATAGTAVTPTSAEAAGSAEATATTAATEATGTATEATVTDAAASDVPAAPAIPKRRRGLAFRAGVLWLLRAVIGIGVFVGGLALGVSFFWSQQPAPLPVADPATDGIPTPAVVREFVGALESNDEDALRAAVAGDPYRLIAGEMQQWGFREVTAVETLATMLNGERTATLIVLRGRDVAGAPIVINLVVHEQDGSITTFR